MGHSNKYDKFETTAGDCYSAKIKPGKQKMQIYNVILATPVGNFDDFSRKAWDRVSLYYVNSNIWHKLNLNIA